MPGPLLAPRTASFRTPEDTELAASASELLGNVSSVAAGAHVTLTSDVGHGLLLLAPDGSFTYRPDQGYVGPDSFRYVLTLGEQTSAAAEVTIDIYLVDAPPAGPAGGFTIGSISRGGPGSPDVTFGSLGPLSFSFVWLIPSLVVSVPGLLLIVLIGAQMMVGAAWLPIVRRNLGDFGFGSRRAT
ncbi:MAG: cadherin-like domain-containing protein [Chloroflexi bacterium]|nr:cadherin-like domain-containing protein [Chloroflexota bacterium]